ncbi:hypothetical protein CONCODRAFT_36040, partial [Conidiobolus coronatus NRRL 28638]
PYHIKVRFEIVENTNLEKEYYAPYNGLLVECFPLSEGYPVAPVAQAVGEGDSIDLTVEYIVERNANPIMFLEIKPPSNLRYISGRQEADSQMKKRFLQLADKYPSFIDVFYGISTFGTRVAYYTLNTETQEIFPSEIEASRSRIVDTAPIGWWDSDIMEVEGLPPGETRFLRMLEEVKARCNNFEASKRQFPGTS